MTPLFSVPTAVAAFAATGGLGTGTVTSGTTTTTSTQSTSTTSQNTSTTSTPAPSGDSSATALEISGVATAGQTSAHSGSDGSSSSADALDLFGQRVAGGDQNGSGTNSGNIFGTGDTPLGDLELAPWSASATDNSAAAEAALAHVNLKDVAEVWLLHSQSDSQWSSQSSSGNSQSDAAEANLGGQLDIKVLHSEAHSNGQGGSDILVINGQDVISSDQVNGQCTIDASPLLVLNCLTATGGTAGVVQSAESDVATVDVGQGALTGTVVGSKTQGGTVAPTTPQGGQTGGGKTGGNGNNGGLGGNGNNGGLGNGAGNNGGAAASGSLPFTGTDAARMTAIAGALASLGMAMVAFARRRRMGSSLAH